jgi:hypothetical protein
MQETCLRTGVGAEVEDAGSRSAADDPAAPRPSFLRIVWENPREPATVLLSAGIALVWGVQRILSSALDPAERGIGALGFLAGATLLLSYTLRFFPDVLAARAWQRGRPRRALRAVLKHSWVAFIVLVVIGGVLELLRRLASAG